MVIRVHWWHGVSYTEMHIEEYVHYTTFQLFRGPYSCPEVLNHSWIICSCSNRCRPWMFSSPNSVSTLRGSYAGRRRPVFDQGAPPGFRHFSCKFLRKIALVTCPCEFRLCRLAQSLRRDFGRGSFPVNSLKKWLLWHVHVHHKVILMKSSKRSCGDPGDVLSCTDPYDVQILLKSPERSLPDLAQILWEDLVRILQKSFKRSVHDLMRRSQEVLVWRPCNNFHIDPYRRSFFDDLVKFSSMSWYEVACT